MYIYEVFRKSINCYLFKGRTEQFKHYLDLYIVDILEHFYWLKKSINFNIN